MGRITRIVAASAVGAASATAMLAGVSTSPGDVRGPAGRAVASPAVLVQPARVAGRSFEAGPLTPAVAQAIENRQTLVASIAPAVPALSVPAVDAQAVDAPPVEVPASPIALGRPSTASAALNGVEGVVAVLLERVERGVVDLLAPRR